MSRIVAQKELAEMLGLSARQIRNLDGIPREGDGYPVPEAVRWYVSYREEIAANRQAPTDLAESEKRLADASASMAELKLARQRGELMTVAEYKRVRYDADQRVAARLKTLPTRCAPLLVGCQTEAEVLTRLEPVVREVMAELFTADDVPNAHEDADAA